jgi:competence protein ComEA
MRSVPRTTVPSADNGSAPDPEFWGEPPRPRPRLPIRTARREGVIEAIADRLRVWREDPRMGVAALVLLALVAGFVWYRVGLGSGTGDGAVAAAPADAEAAAQPGPSVPLTSTPTTQLPSVATVHVAGAVTVPGVVELPGGSRVIDAVEAAGGALPDADLDRLNLAAPLADGDRVLVQRVGDPPAATVTPGAPAAGETAPAGPTNLNTASQAELETLPGIGPVLAQAIIAERERRGGFRSVNELRDVRGIGDARFAELESLVTV